jgi:hypothetical protein
MARPEGLKSKLKDNSKKLHRNRAEWMAGKKLGRPKQVFVYNNGHGWAGLDSGHWEKVPSVSL